MVGEDTLLELKARTVEPGCLCTHPIYERWVGLSACDGSVSCKLVINIIPHSIGQRIKWVNERSTWHNELALAITLFIFCVPVNWCWRRQFSLITNICRCFSVSLLCLCSVLCIVVGIGRYRNWRTSYTPCLKLLFSGRYKLLDSINADETCYDRESTGCDGKTLPNVGASRKAFLLGPEGQIGISEGGRQRVWLFQAGLTDVQRLWHKKAECFWGTENWM